MLNKLPISAIIITNRYDYRLDQAIDSIHFADEIIIKKTGQILDFSKIRNEMIQKAKHDWVFFLDSDEYLDMNNNFKQSIKNLLTDKNVSGISFKRIDVFHEKKLFWGETRNNFQLRLFRKDKFIYYGKVHEVIIPRESYDYRSKKNTMKNVVKNDDASIIHNSHLSISEFFLDICAYAKIHSLDLSKNKNRLVVEMLAFPTGKFFTNFILRLGFLDGWRGFTYAILMSLHSLISRVIAYENISKNSS